MTQFKTKSCWEYIVLSLSIKDPNISYAKKAKAAEKGRKRRRGGGTAQGDVDCAYISRGVLTVEKISIETLVYIVFFWAQCFILNILRGRRDTSLQDSYLGNGHAGIASSSSRLSAYFSFRGPDVATVVGF